MYGLKQRRQQEQQQQLIPQQPRQQLFMDKMEMIGHFYVQLVRGNDGNYAI